MCSKTASNIRPTVGHSFQSAGEPIEHRRSDATDRNLLVFGEQFAGKKTSRDELSAFPCTRLMPVTVGERPPKVGHCDGIVWFMEMAAQERNERGFLLFGGLQTYEQLPPEACIIAGLKLLHAAEKVRANIGSIVADPIDVREFGTVLGNADQLREHALLLFHKPKLDERSQNINSNGNRLLSTICGALSSVVARPDLTVSTGWVGSLQISSVFLDLTNSINVNASRRDAKRY